MEMCDSHHEEIVHDERNCPLCEALDVIKQQEKDIEELNAKIERLQDVPIE